MRLAYVTETFPPEVNGVALTVARTVRDLRERGHVVDLIRPRQPTDAADGAAAGRTEWLTRGWPIPMYPDLRFGFARAGALRERFRQSRVDLVHIATPGPLGFEALNRSLSSSSPRYISSRAVAGTWWEMRSSTGTVPRRTQSTRAGTTRVSV